MTEKFDPRFDPRYQPGYQDASGGRHGVTTPNDTEPRKLISPPPSNEESEPDSVVAAAGEADADHSAELEVNPHPFERTLWVVAAFFVFGGVAIAYWANSLNYMAVDTGLLNAQLIQISAWALSGPMVTAGLATAVGLLFRRAIAWKPHE